MTTDPLPSAPRIRDRLAGHHVLVTGSTGFLAKAFIEKLLRSVETIGGIHLLVRVKPGGLSAQERVTRGVLTSRAFDRLRATQGNRFEQLCAEKIHVVTGDLGSEKIGLDGGVYDALTKRISLVVNCAATVTFDERLDLAVELNTLGPSRLLRFARDCGNVPLMHVSTCYVCGARRGVVVEDFGAPEQARKSLPRKAVGGEFDLDALVQSLRDEAAAVRKIHGAETEAGRKELTDIGMRLARRYGWNDTYTFTKWIGEQLLLRDHGPVPCTVFRPAIIEGSYDEPTPGWIDGLRMADPMIIAYGRGKLAEFPAKPDIALDLIPVDFVANAMIATLPVDRERPDEVAVYHCASSNRHPLKLEVLREALERAFAKRPMVGDDGQPIHPPRLRLTDSTTFLKRWSARQRRVAWLRSVLERLRPARRYARRLASVSRQIEQLIYFAKIYSPYTHLDCRFADEALRSVAAALHPDDRAEFPFDVSLIDWDDYVVNRHVPGVRSFVLGTGWEPSARIRAVEPADSSDGAPGFEALRGKNLFDVFRRSAQRFPAKFALQTRRANRWVRYTYDEALRATGTIMRRLGERGLQPGDRLVICGENGPEWGLTYLAAMRAGLTAVPLDPQLPPADVWAAARFVDAKLVCAGTTTVDAIAGTRDSTDTDVVVMAHPFIPPPAASRDLMPDPVFVDDATVASILFTSGTTVFPKAVQLTHGNFMANAAALLQVHPCYPTDELLSVLPLYHAFEFTGGFIAPLAAGATITYVEHLQGPEIRSVMQATGTTVMLVVPRLIRLFHDAITKQVASAGMLRRATFRLLGLLSDLSGGRAARWLFRPVHNGFGGRLRMFVSGGSRLDPDLFDAFVRLGFPVYEGYGLTETAPVLTVNPPARARGGSVGTALPNVEIEIRNQNLEGIGEVWAKGPNVMSGYLNNPQATKEVLAGDWFRTGDLGRMDDDGYLYLTGRSKDLIITAAGKNVYPDEVETRYRELPYVNELCVFGMPTSDGSGDTVHAVVVTDPADHPDTDPSTIAREIRLAVESISETLPPHQRIAVLHFWSRELPKTSTLKAKRSLIRETVVAEERSSRAGNAPTVTAAGESEETLFAAPRSNPAAFSVVCEILAAQSKQPSDAIRPHMHLLLDLGIDSIGRMDVLGAIEARFRMHLSDERAAKIARVSDILGVIADRRPTEKDADDHTRWHRQPTPTATTAGLNGTLPLPFRPIRWLMRGSVAAFMNTYVRIRVVGRENIPEEGGFILAPNHSSHLDSPAVVAAIGGKRRVWVAGAEDYFFNTRLKRFVFGKVFDTIAFDREADGLRGLRRCGDALSRGDGLLMFPEGTRSLTGELQPFKIGVAVLAIERGTPIVPVHIARTFDLFRKGQRVVRPGTATVTFASPITPPSIDEVDDPHAAFRALTEQVERVVVALRDEAHA
ncbi:MAG: AMP-binding protein [Planctomycetes bacterium]|nr:AMP-binding protein [Planctomycetota bacterium]